MQPSTTTTARPSRLLPTALLVLSSTATLTASFRVVVDSSNCTSTLFTAALNQHELGQGATFNYYLGTPYNPSTPTSQPVSSFPSNQSARTLIIEWEPGLFVSNTFFPLTFDVRNATGQLLRIPNTSELDVQTKQVAVRCQPSIPVQSSTSSRSATATATATTTTSSSSSSTASTQLASSSSISTTSIPAAGSTPTTNPNISTHQDNAQNHSNVPKIVGAVVGSILGTALLALLLLFCCLKRQRQKSRGTTEPEGWDDDDQKAAHSSAILAPAPEQQQFRLPFNRLVAALPWLNSNHEDARAAPAPPSINPFEADNMRSFGPSPLHPTASTADVDAKSSSLRSEYAKRFAAAAVLASQLAMLLSGHARHARGERRSVPVSDVESNHAHIVSAERQAYENMTEHAHSPPQPLPGSHIDSPGHWAPPAVTSLPHSPQSPPPRSITPISPLPPMQTAFNQEPRSMNTTSGPSRQPPSRPLSLSLPPPRPVFERGPNRIPGYGASAGRFLDVGPALSSIQSEPSERTGAGSSSDAGQKEAEEQGNSDEPEGGNAVYPVGRKSSAGNLYSPIASVVDTTEREDLAPSAAASHRTSSEPPTPSTTSDSTHSRFGFIRIRDRPSSSGNEQSSLDRSRQSTPTSVPPFPSASGSSRPGSSLSLQRQSLSPRPSPPAVAGPRPMVFSPQPKSAASTPLTSPLPSSTSSLPSTTTTQLPAQNQTAKIASVLGPMSIPMPPPLPIGVHPASLASPVQTPASQLSPEELKAQALLSGWVIQGEPSPQPGHQSWLQQRPQQQARAP